MQVDLATVATLFAAVLGALLGVYVALLKYTISEKDKHNEERFAAIQLKLTHEAAARIDGDKAAEEERKKLTERLHMDELAIVKLQGENALLRQTQDGHGKAFDELEDKVVTKQEFEARMDGLEKSIDRLTKSIESPGRYQQPRYSPAAGTPSTDPPKNR